jgi:hypothetical protein
MEQDATSYLIVLPREKFREWSRGLDFQARITPAPSR